MRKQLLVLVGLVMALSMTSVNSHAIPVLQIYIDGATYDTDTETWVTSESEFDLWVVGNVDAHGAILDVVLTASFFGLSGSISFTPITTTTITDPSVPAAPVLADTGTGSHTVLPNHGIFNDPTVDHWDDYALGDMTLTDSPIADYNGNETFPTSFPNDGQVNVYRVTVEGWNKVHFDAYGETMDTTTGHRNFWKTPFSHDGTVPVESQAWGGIKSLFR